MTKVAISGANGYIGRNVLASLAKTPLQCIALVRKPTASDQRYFSLSDEANYETILDDIDVLVHLAYDFSGQDYDSAYALNAITSKRLFSAAKKAGVKKIIFISTQAAHQSARSDYGRVKFAMESIAASFGAVIIRPGLVYGQCEQAGAGGILSKFENLLKVLPLFPLIGTGKRPFHTCHMQDLTQLILQLIETEQHYHRPIIAANSHAISLKQILKSMATTLGVKRWFLPVPTVLFYAALKLAHVCRVPTGFRLDAFKTLTSPNLDLDFSATQQTGVAFRSFLAESNHPSC